MITRTSQSLGARPARGLAGPPFALPLSYFLSALRPAALILSFLAGEDFLNKEWRQGSGGNGSNLPA
ncbi:MAG: hypothetical protein NTY93_01290 [Candidatus Kaiserbacteria bacterium]|nr:hypothetical protein [Candidatus Kaiserbacteria bacterium]